MPDETIDADGEHASNEGATAVASVQGATYGRLHEESDPETPVAAGDGGEDGGHAAGDSHGEHGEGERPHNAAKPEQWRPDALLPNITMAIGSFDGAHTKPDRFMAR